VEPERFGYKQAVGTLEVALTFGIHPSLETIRALTGAMARPHEAFASVQVTGTNGKSSVARMTAALLRAHGVRTGCYTSPHLRSYTERIEINGIPIAEERFAEAISAALQAQLRARAAGALRADATEFELLTASALWAFREAAVEVAVLEVGMGGRWDATSVVSPAVAVITGVALDHTAQLGTTREAIARDKAHIIGPDSVPVLGPGTAGLDEIFLARAAECETQARVVREIATHSPLAEEFTTRYGVVERPGGPDGATALEVRTPAADYTGLRLRTPAYQAPNAATAIAVAEAALGRALDPVATAGALQALRLPGRFEVLARDPWLVVDGAHNPEAATVLATAIADAWPDAGHRPAIVLGVLADKDAHGIVGALAPVAERFICVTPPSTRALTAAEVAVIVEAVTGAVPAVAELGAAVRSLRASATDTVVTGSLTTVAAIDPATIA
jgi:dihydrofolate synthase/folylpolyglutamate synthase